MRSMPLQLKQSIVMLPVPAFLRLRGGANQDEHSNEQDRNSSAVDDPGIPEEDLPLSGFSDIEFLDSNEVQCHSLVLRTRW
jgi:hypothetical protein